jgi:hypothetical protein
VTESFAECHVGSMLDLEETARWLLSWLTTGIDPDLLAGQQQ